MKQPSLRPGESLDEFHERLSAWIASWDLDAALTWLDGNAVEGQHAAQAAKLVRSAFVRLRQEATLMATLRDRGEYADGMRAAGRLLLRVLDWDMTGR